MNNLNSESSLESIPQIESIEAAQKLDQVVRHYEKKKVTIKGDIFKKDDSIANNYNNNNYNIKNNKYNKQVHMQTDGSGLETIPYIESLDNRSNKSNNIFDQVQVKNKNVNNFIIKSSKTQVIDVRRKNESKYLTNNPYSNVKPNPNQAQIDNENYVNETLSKLCEEFKILSDFMKVKDVYIIL